MKISIYGAKKTPIEGVPYSNREGAATIEFETSPDKFEEALKSAGQRLVAAIDCSYNQTGAGKEPPAPDGARLVRYKKNLDLIMGFIKSKNLTDELSEYAKSKK